jgi:DNA-binding MurR/RpiR family transcriptional regulator
MTDETLAQAAESGAPRQVSPRIRAALPSLQPSDARVAQLFLDEPDAVIHRSVSEVAEEAGSSTATVVRCAQKLGFRGFHDLKLALAQELAAFGGRLDSAGRDDGDASVLARVTAAGAEIVRDAAALVDEAAFQAAVEALDAARKVLVVGVGTSAPLAQDAAYRLRVVGVEAEAPADVHVQHVASRLLTSADVCLAISHTGSTRETIAATTSAHTAGARTLAITSFLRSPLTETADVVLTAGAREVSFRLEAMSSRLAHMAVIDALLVGLAERDEARTEAIMSLYTDVLSEHRY